MPEQQAVRCQWYLWESAKVRLGGKSRPDICQHDQVTEMVAGKCGDVDRTHGETESEALKVNCKAG